ncbi:hypothetical protein HYALB_00011892 [Hymenoscyphus albidus]|uniref:Uncharacterized protein n=1 Tax=Hymenoscyphus albidus TaxID=595503 RepID=A0A9N9LTB8_9HELO|nr:hypothetical protein HYALB_00011892 [Hymenoscyphus albidus]
MTIPTHSQRLIYYGKLSSSPPNSTVRELFKRRRKYATFVTEYEQSGSAIANHANSFGPQASQQKVNERPPHLLVQIMLHAEQTDGTSGSITTHELVIFAKQAAPYAKRLKCTRSLVEGMQCLDTKTLFITINAPLPIQSCSISVDRDFTTLSVQIRYKNKDDPAI